MELNVKTQCLEAKPKHGLQMNAKAPLLTQFAYLQLWLFPFNIEPFRVFIKCSFEILCILNKIFVLTLGQKLQP